MTEVLLLDASLLFFRATCESSLVRKKMDSKRGIDPVDEGYTG